MALLTLQANETKMLVAAAADAGRLALPTRLKQTTRQRLAERFTQHGLVEPVGDELHLTRAGYRAVGLRPPRAVATPSDSGQPQVSTRDRMGALLRRDEGASLAELTEATGWLPHTTRAALSRLRSAGQALGKSKREDGTTCYKLMPPALAPARAARKGVADAAAAAVVAEVAA